MEKRFKKPAIVFLVLNIVFLVGFIGCFIANIFVTGNSDFYNVLVEQNLKEIWNVLSFANGFDATNYLFYVVYGIILIAVVMIIVGIILVIKRQRKRLMWYLIPFVLTVTFAVDVASQMPITIDFFKVVGEIFNTNPASVILTIAVLACGVLAYIFSFFVYFFGLAYAKSHLEVVTKTEEVAAPANEAAEVTPVAATPVTEDVNEEFGAAPVIADANKEDLVVEDTEAPVTVAPMADFLVEPEEIAAQPEEIVVEEIPTENAKDVDPKDAPVTKDDLASILKDIVRDIVRDEIARSEAKKEEERPHRETAPQPGITGATFGGPLVVQYFNGGINSPVEPAKQVSTPVVVAPVAPAPVAPVAPVAEVKKPAPFVKKEKVEEKPQEVAPVVAPAPVAEPVPEAPVEEKKPIIRIPFTERLLDAEDDLKNNYNEIKNELLSWGLKSRISNSGDTFRLHTKTYVKVTIAGKGLKLYFALNPRDYSDSTLPIADASDKSIYEEIPLVFKVKSALSVRRCKQLIKDCCEKDALTQGEIETTNWVKELKAAQKAKKADK